MSGTARAIDHVGIVGAALAPLAETYVRLGFHVAPAAHHAGGRTGNHCVMLHGSYLELIATLPGGTSATLARFLGRYAGAHVLSLRIDDQQAAAGRLVAAGFPAVEPSATDRALDAADPDGPRVGFVLLTPPDPPEGRVHLIRHLTPDVMWQDRFLDHPNRARRLAGVEVVVPDPAASAAWFSRLAGRPVVPDPSGGYALPMDGATLRLLPADGGFDGPLPWIRTLRLTTDDDNDALLRLLTDRDIPHQRDGAGVILRQDDLFLRFDPEPA